MRSECRQEVELLAVCPGVCQRGAGVAGRPITIPARAADTSPRDARVHLPVVRRPGLDAAKILVRKRERLPPSPGVVPAHDALDGEAARERRHAEARGQAQPPLLELAGRGQISQPSADVGEVAVAAEHRGRAGTDGGVCRPLQVGQPFGLARVEPRQAPELKRLGLKLGEPEFVGDARGTLPAASGLLRDVPA